MTCSLNVVGSPPPKVRLLLDGKVIRSGAGDVDADDVATTTATPEHSSLFTYARGNNHPTTPNPTQITTSDTQKTTQPLESPEAPETWNSGAEIWKDNGHVSWTDVEANRNWQGCNLTCLVYEGVHRMEVTKTINVAYGPKEVEKV